MAGKYLELFLTIVFTPISFLLFGVPLSIPSISFCERSSNFFNSLRDSVQILSDFLNISDTLSQISIVIDIIPTNGADKRKFFPFAPYFPVTNVIKRYFYPSVINLFQQRLRSPFRRRCKALQGLF